MSSMLNGPNSQPSKPPKDRSWIYITGAVVAVHCLCIGWAVFFHSQAISKQKIPQRLVVQTIALNANPLPKAPLPKNPLPKQPIPPTPIMPTPLEHKSNSPNYEPINRQQTTPKPEPTPQPQSSPYTPPEFIPQQPQQPVPPPKTTPVVKPTVKQPPKPLSPPAPKEPPKPIEQPKPKEPPKPKEAPKEAPKPAAPPPPAKPTYKVDLRHASQKADEEAKKFQEEQQKKKEAQLVELQRQQKLVAEAKERMAKISGSRDKIPSKAANSLSSVPTAITSLEVDALSVPKNAPIISQYEVSYRDELAARLKLLLRLPEYGDVKVNLTLTRSGKVDKVAIVSAESILNRKYIEKTLPELSFPAFGNNFAAASEYTFAITLSNEI